jgi:hypothetical protein
MLACKGLYRPLPVRVDNNLEVCTEHGMVSSNTTSLKGAYSEITKNKQRP